ncbi:alpha-2-macroglobulin family protein [Hymenobacter qilianensis]|uniref:alpha-2-macroglobulin family protein n=1 Tax=Hymenobacter qilianensis TaxID=1385715 RepID=UPI001CB984BE|nr:alpha-2-macroglobulin family protein [Hymenobacter qilianensis]
MKFIAKGEDASQQKRGPWEPGYVFEVTADVTDAAGETRTGQQQVSIGKEALTLRLELPELLNREKMPPVRLFSTNATGEAQPARGTLRLYRLTPPARALRPRTWERPEREALSPEEFKRLFPLDAYAREDNDSTWARTLVLTQDFDTEKSTLLPLLATPLAQQAPGRYLLEATASTDATAQPAKTERRFTLYAPSAKTLPVPAPDWFVALQDSVAPGQPARFLVGSSEAGARVLLEAEAKGESLRREWLTLAAGEQRLIEIPVPASLGETQLYVHTTQVRDNRLYTHTAPVQVATPPAPLVLSIATFRDKLQPGQRETWRVTIRQTDGKPADAELLATLYDQSLDAFRPHSFRELEFPKPYHPAALAWQGRFDTQESNELMNQTVAGPNVRDIAYPHINMWGFDGEDGDKVYMMVESVKGNTDLAGMAADEVVVAQRSSSNMAKMRVPPPPPPPSAPPAPGMSDDLPDMDELRDKPANLSGVQARKDFRETAFWMPELRTNAQGETVLEFQMPEAVTRWQLLALAHDQQLHSDLLRRELVTQKQLQVTPNAPRFFREGDQLRLTAKLSNLTDQPMQGTAQLFLLDARTQQPLEGTILKSAANLPFDLKANQSSALAWNLAIPETAEGQVPLEAITYRVVAQTTARNRLSAKPKKRPRPLCTPMGRKIRCPCYPTDCS